MRSLLLLLCSAPLLTFAQQYYVSGVSQYAPQYSSTHYQQWPQQYIPQQQQFQPQQYYQQQQYQPVQVQPQHVQYQVQSPPYQQVVQQPQGQVYAPRPQFQAHLQQQHTQYQQPMHSGSIFPRQPPPPPPQAPVGNPYQQQVFREQPRIYQTIVRAGVPEQPRIAPPPPPPPPPAPLPQPEVSAPPPPEKFVPYIADIYNGNPAVTAASPTKQPPPTIVHSEEQMPAGAFIPEEVVVDGGHPAYIENIENTLPTMRKPKVQQKPTQIEDVVPVDNTIEARAIPEPVTEKPRRPHKKPKTPKANLPTLTDAKTPSEAFLGCCQHRKVAKACERICSFDVLSKKTLTGMFLGTDPCPQSYGLDLLQCAAQDDDHTVCCMENGVHATQAGKKCLGFCNMKPGVSFQADVSMLPCWAVLNDIKRCFKKNIEAKLEQRG